MGAAAVCEFIGGPTKGKPAVEEAAPAAGSTMIAQLLSLPAFPAARSSTINVQVPRAFIPASEARACSGRFHPRNGADALLNKVEERSSKTALILSPDPPRWLNNCTVAQVGDFKVIRKSLSLPCVMFTFKLIRPIVTFEPMVNVEVVVPRSARIFGGSDE